jgi:hypothetical protein
MKSSKNTVILAVICLITGLIIGFYAGKSKCSHPVTKEAVWSIGIYTGKTPFDLNASEIIKNPVLTAKDVTDVPAKFVADPFMIREGSTWHMFFEVYNGKTNHGDIGYATSEDGHKWEYNKIVLDEDFHLSYPYVFKWQDQYYMIPESFDAKSVRLYKAVDFPAKWAFVKTLLDGESYVDPCIFRHAGKWWLFTATPSCDILKFYYADVLEGPWKEHPKSPVVEGDADMARPGGRVLTFDNRIIRYTQDAYPTYGNQVWAYEIAELTTTSYKEKLASELPIVKLTGGTAWNGQGMHHVDPHQIGEKKWMACVDGLKEY